jgi:hypothetical protein
VTGLEKEMKKRRWEKSRRQGLGKEGDGKEELWRKKMRGWEKGRRLKKEDARKGEDRDWGKREGKEKLWRWNGWEKEIKREDVKKEDERLGKEGE